jgi:hypothetical protein
MEDEKNDVLQVDDDLGEVVQTKQIMRGVYYVVALDPEMTQPHEYYIVDGACEWLTAEAAEYGHRLQHHPMFLAYGADSPDDGRPIVEYEMNRYLVRNGLPAIDECRLLDIVTFGREYYPEYFGDYPVPAVTPRGATLRYVSISKGAFLIETDQIQKVLAICYPVWACELSEYAKEESEMLEYDLERGIHETEGYLFFPESSACLALYELWSAHRTIAESPYIDFAAMLNSLWIHFPEYVVAHNMLEQAGLNDVFGLFLRALGIETDLKCDESSLIALTEGCETDYLRI